MRLDPNPSFRKVILPWYDSELVCVVVILLMICVLLFSLAGLSVAFEQDAFHRYFWMPLFLALPSGFVIISTALRMIRRNMARFFG